MGVVRERQWALAGFDGVCVEVDEGTAVEAARVTGLRLMTREVTVITTAWEVPAP